MVLGEADLTSLHGDIELYYTAKVRAYGPCAAGVDWSCTPTQELRFVQLLKLCDSKQRFSLNDFGCGYGALRGFLDRRFDGIEVDYLGIDISPEMVRQARMLWAHKAHTVFVVGTSLTRVADYSLVSGVFNIKLHQPHARWTQFVKDTLVMLNQYSRRGFAVNFLAPTTYDRPPIAELYTTTADIWVAYCKRTLHLDADVLADYGMNEFTLVARRPTHKIG